MVTMGRSIIFVKDMTVMSEFYRDVLGLTPVDESDEGWKVYGAGSVEFALHAIPAPWNEEIEITDPPVPRSDAVTKLVFMVGDLRQSYQELKAKGVMFRDEPDDTSTYCDFFDPEGNVFQIASS